MRAATLTAAALALAAASLGGCNAILGNSDFSGPGSGPGTDGGVDACMGSSCSAPIDASMACQDKGMPPTSIVGQVTIPSGVLGVPGVAVYVPTTALDPIGDGVTCGKCANELSGTPLVITHTDDNGHFRLENVPFGADVPVVFQIGRWRRQIKVTTAECADTTVAPAQTHLPRNKTEGDLPKIAIVTGQSDTLECLVRKVGIDDAEITTAPGIGRVQLFAGTGAAMFAPGFPTTGAFAPGPQLVGAPAFLDDYDLILFGCSAGADQPATQIAMNLVDYANEGGRLLFVHYENTYLKAAPPWTALGTFDPGGGGLAGPGMLAINESFPGGKSFANWLLANGASQMEGKLAIPDGRNSCMQADPNLTQTWATLDPANSGGNMGTQIFTFQTPIEAPTTVQCGRVLFSDLHESLGGSSQAFPGECNMQVTTQDDALIYMLFQLSSCVP